MKLAVDVFLALCVMLGAGTLVFSVRTIRETRRRYPRDRQP